MKGLMRALALLIVLLAVPAGGEATQWNLVILFTADIQGQLDPFDLEAVDQGEVSTQQVGGVARLAWAMGQSRERFPGMTLVLSCGDDLLGPYAYSLGGTPNSGIMDQLPYDAGSLGNHEFDRGDAFLAEALKTRPFPIVESNLSIDPQSPLHGLTLPYMVVERNGLKIGLFGLINSDLAIISNPGEYVVASEDFAAAAREMVAVLKEQHHVDLIVAMAHIGLQNSRELAAAAPEIDVICVGDSVTLVERGRELVQHPDGSSTIVIQSGYRGEYLGLLKLEVAGGEVVQYHWQPLHLDASIPEDPAVAAQIEQYHREMPEQNVVVRTLAPIDLRKRSLRTGESPFGSLVADIVRERFQSEVALLNSGMFRGDQVLPAGPITDADLALVFPFGDTVHLLSVPGAVLRLALERGVSALPEAKGWFLQVSGMRFTVDISRPAQELLLDADGRATAISRQGERITGVEILGPDGDYHPLDPDAMYNVATNAFISGGGDGFFMFGELGDRRDTALELKGAVEEALAARGEIKPQASGRILFGNE